MSGGYLKDGLKDFEHEVVIFTFKGPIDVAKCNEWNRQIRALKQTLGDKVMGVTIEGLPTPGPLRTPPGP